MICEKKNYFVLNGTPTLQDITDCISVANHFKVTVQLEWLSNDNKFMSKPNVIYINWYDDANELFKKLEYKIEGYI